MKLFVAFLLVAFCGVMPCALAQGLDDEYVQIFKLIQEADATADSAPRQALARYQEAQVALDRLHKGSPDWNTRIVDYRLTYLADRIATLSAATSAAAQVQTNDSKTNASPTVPGRPAAPADWQAQMATLQDNVGQLQSEKALLEAKLKEALAMRPAAADPAELAKAEDKIKILQKENELLKVGLDKEKQAQKETATRADDTARVKQLELQRNDLQQQFDRERAEYKKQLDAANKAKSAATKKAPAPRVQDLEKQLAAAQARLEALDARALPYTPEELALLKRPQANLANPEPKPTQKSVKDLPPGSAALVAEAQRYFAARQFDKAETAYLQVLRQDPKNVPTLANLAAIQVEAGEFDKADANVKSALVQDPEDSYALYVLGILRFRQAKYDEALEALSHAAKLDPQNADVQNYLGLALSEKGQRVPAEAALRKAIQLQPNYAGAHYNLAVIYLTQQPPAIELARWHYQKAIGAGHPHNPDLEKRFEAHP